MTEQEYRVIADRDKGDDPSGRDVRIGDRWTLEHVPSWVSETRVVRIERPVPTTDRTDLTRDQFSNDESYYLATGQHPSVPTREQIADEVKGIVIGSGYYSTSIHHDEALDVADAVLALIQKGADR